jgi:hypothetical protein
MKINVRTREMGIEAKYTKDRASVFLFLSERLNNYRRFNFLLQNSPDPAEERFTQIEFGQPKVQPGRNFPQTKV